MHRHARAATFCILSERQVQNIRRMLERSRSTTLVTPRARLKKNHVVFRFHSRDGHLRSTAKRESSRAEPSRI